MPIHTQVELCRAVPVPALAALLPIPFPAVKEYLVGTATALWGQRKPVPGAALSPRTTLSALWSPHTVEEGCVS